MAIIRTLGGIELPDGIDWENQYESRKVSQSVEQTLGGRSLIFETRRHNGHPITLIAALDLCWFEPAIRDELITLSDQVGQTHLFQWGDNESAVPVFSTQVVFDHTRGPAVQLNPIVQLHETYFFGRINLIDAGGS